MDRMFIAVSRGSAKMRRPMSRILTSMYSRSINRSSIQTRIWFRILATEFKKINITMKNLIIVFLIGVVVMLAASCDDGVVSEKHVYTEAELKLKDSLEAAR